MIAWREVPWTLWLWAVGVYVSFAILVVNVIHRSGSARQIFPLILTLGIISLWPYYMFKGVRWLWIATLGFDALILVIETATGGERWADYLFVAVQMVLLLLPVTRRFFSPESAGAAAS